MKKVIFILALIILIACNQKTKTITPAIDSKKDKFTELAKFYQEKSFNELFIYPDYHRSKSKYAFEGNQIDSVTFNFLTENATDGAPWTEGFFGIYSFKINEQYTGLITRTPAEYASTRISLWIYDHKKDSICNNMRLANVFGDAGDFQTVNSYLFFDKDNQLKALTYIYSSYDHRVEDENDSTIDEHTNYYLTKINFTSLDTITTDSLTLNNQFKQQLEKLASF